MTKKPRKGSKEALQAEISKLKHEIQRLKDDHNSIRRGASELLLKNFDLSEKLSKAETPPEQRITELEAVTEQFKKDLAESQILASEWQEKCKEHELRYSKVYNDICKALGIDEDEFMQGYLLGLGAKNR